MPSEWSGKSKQTEPIPAEDSSCSDNIFSFSRVFAEGAKALKAGKGAKQPKAKGQTLDDEHKVRWSFEGKERKGNEVVVHLS